MKSMVKKAKDNSGATIIMALLFMLICVMVSTVLLATAGTASRDVSRQREQQQAYLAVSSAVDFIKNDICNCKYQTEPALQVSAINGDSETLNKMAFTALLTAALQADRSEKPYKAEFDMSFSDPELSVLGVSVELSVNKNDIITAVCTAYKDADKKVPAYQMTAKFKTADVNGDQNCSTWELSSVSKGS